MCDKGIDILDLIEDTVEVNAKTFGLKVLEKVAALGVDDDTMFEFEELVATWAEKMEEDVEYLLELIGKDDCDCCCDDECHCHDCDCEDEECCCDETCTCGCQEGEPCTCHNEPTCGCDETCTCGCQEGKPCTCEHEEGHCTCGCEEKPAKKSKK